MASLQGPTGQTAKYHPLIATIRSCLPHRNLPSKTANKYVDFRKLYDDSSDIAAVVVATTEHPHAFAVLPAIKLGKHVYCEKPLAHNVWEARLLAEEASKATITAQMGTQMHAQNNFR